MKLGSHEMLLSVAKPIASASEHFETLPQIMQSAPHKFYGFFDEISKPVTLFLDENLHFEGFVHQPLRGPSPFQQIIYHCRQLNPDENWDWLLYQELLRAVEEQLEITCLCENGLAHLTSFSVFQVLTGKKYPTDNNVVTLAA